MRKCSFPALAGTSGTWANTGSMNIDRFAHTATLLQNGQVLVAGGGGSAGIQASAELYNPATGKWTFTGSMTTARYFHTAVLLPSGEVLVPGGSNNEGLTAEAELYNPSTGQWTKTGSMETPRSQAGSTLLQDGQVLVAGGYLIASAELYNPATGMWTFTGSMHYARESQAALLQNGQVLMAGGNTAELYSNGSWTLTSNLKFGAGPGAVPLTNGDVVVFGGNSNPSEFYNPSTNTWTVAVFSGNTHYGPLTLLNTGEVLLAGGESSYGADAICDLYNSSINEWLRTGTMNHPRSEHTATLLQNGQVLAGGGQVKNLKGGFITLASAELYTP